MKWARNGKSLLLSVRYRPTRCLLGLLKWNRWCPIAKERRWAHLSEQELYRSKLTLINRDILNAFFVCTIVELKIEISDFYNDETAALQVSQTCENSR